MNFIKKHWFGILFTITVILTSIVGGLFILLFSMYGVNGVLGELGTVLAQNDIAYKIMMIVGMISILITMFLFTYLMYYRKDLQKKNKRVFYAHFVSTIIIGAFTISITYSTNVMMVAVVSGFVYMIALAVAQERQERKLGGSKSIPDKPRQKKEDVKRVH